MTDFEIPFFVRDPPIDKYGFQHERDQIVRRWLALLGHSAQLRQVASAELLQTLLTRIRAAEKDVNKVLDEAQARSFFKRQLLYFEAVPHEAEARARFVRLATMTYRFLRRHSVRFPYASVLAENPRYTIEQLGWGHLSLPESVKGEASIGRALKRSFNVPVNRKLINELAGWELTWNAMVARNPILELRERMHEIFDNHMCNSWEGGSERLIDEWAARGTRDPLPFFDRHGLLSQAYYRRLCELRSLCNGWYFWREDINAIVYVSRAEWDAIRAQQPSNLNWCCNAVNRRCRPAAESIRGATMAGFSGYG
jgi:hypothetical protein